MTLPAGRRDAAHGMVAMSSIQAEAAAVRAGVLASRIVSAALRASAGTFDDIDLDALVTLVNALSAESRTKEGASRDYESYAFAHVTFQAAPRRDDIAADLDAVLADAELLLRAANSGRIRPAKALGTQQAREAAERLADRYRAVSDRVMSEIGGPGDSVGSMTG